MLSINLWRLPNISVEIGNKKEIPIRECKFSSNKRFCNFYYKRRKLRIGRNTTTSTGTKRTANIVMVWLMIVRLGTLSKCGIAFAIIIHIATRHYRQCQNVNAEYVSKNSHSGAKLVICFNCNQNQKLFLHQNPNLYPVIDFENYWNLVYILIYCIV